MAILRTSVVTVLIALGTWAQAGDLTQNKKTLTLEGVKEKSDPFFYFIVKPISE